MVLAEEIGLGLSKVFPVRRMRSSAMQVKQRLPFCLCHVLEEAQGGAGQPGDPDWLFFRRHSPTAAACI